jgi:hypothetical protein
MFPKFSGKSVFKTLGDVENYSAQKKLTLSECEKFHVCWPKNTVLNKIISVKKVTWITTFAKITNTCKYTMPECHCLPRQSKMALVLCKHASHHVKQKVDGDCKYHCGSQNKSNFSLLSTVKCFVVDKVFQGRKVVKIIHARHMKCMLQKTFWHVTCAKLLNQVKFQAARRYTFVLQTPKHP